MHEHTTLFTHGSPNVINALLEMLLDIRLVGVNHWHCLGMKPAWMLRDLVVRYVKYVSNPILLQ